MLVVHRSIEANMSVKTEVAVDHGQDMKENGYGHERIPAPLRSMVVVHSGGCVVPIMDVVVVRRSGAEREI